MSLARKIAWNTGIQIAGKTLSTILGVMIIGLMTRLLGKEGFGAYTTANAFLQIFALLLDMGIQLTLVSLLGEHAGDKEYEKRCVSATFTLRVVMGIAMMFIAAPLIGWFMPYSFDVKLAIMSLSASYFFPALIQILVGVQQRHLRTEGWILAENIGRIVTLSGLFLGRELGWGIQPIMWVISAASIANFAYNLWAVRAYADVHWRWDPAFWKVLLTRSWPIGISILFNLVYFKADTLILAAYYPKDVIGVYGAAYRVLELLITVPFLYAGVLLPILSNAWANLDRVRFKHFMDASLDVMMLLGAPVAIGTWFLGERIMMLIAGPEFAEAGQILRILIIAVFIIYLNTVYAHAILALSKQKAMLPVYIFTAIVTLGGYLIFIPRYGVWAAAWLTVLSEAIVLFGNTIISSRAAHLKFRAERWLAILLSSIGMAIIVRITQHAPLIIPILSGACFYSICLFITGAVTRQTIEHLMTPAR